MDDKKFKSLIWRITQNSALNAIGDLTNGRVPRRFHNPVSRFIVGYREDEREVFLALREVVSLAVERQTGKLRLVSRDFGSKRDGWCIRHLETLEVPVHKNLKKYLQGQRSLPAHTPQQEEEQYAADDALRLAKQRVGHSLFSERVTHNFEGRCCLTGISERELLVAGHIVPWSEERQLRLDPGNGLLLEARYDRLFEEGYFTLTDDLVVQVTKTKGISKSLRKLLKRLDGRQAREPAVWPINPAYLDRHRQEKFKG